MYIADTFPNAPHYVTPSCFPPHHIYPTIVVIAPMYVYLYFTISFTVHSLLREMPAHGGGGRRAGGKTRNAWCKTDVTVWLTPHLTSLPLLSSPFITPTHLAILLDLASALQSENENVSTIQTQCQASVLPIFHNERSCEHNTEAMPSDNACVNRHLTPCLPAISSHIPSPSPPSPAITFPHHASFTRLSPITQPSLSAQPHFSS